MRPFLHPFLVNGRTGDPALYVETMFERDALLFDLGDIKALPPRKIHRLAQVFVSHAHVDHFCGFDHLLRVLVGREKTIDFFGPRGFIDQVHHKLQAYSWNLVGSYASDLVLVTTEIDGSFATRTVQFRLKNAFAPEPVREGRASAGTLVNERAYRVSVAILDHHIPCLAFAVDEASHVNVWKNRLTELGLSVGPWLRDLKQAVYMNRPDAHLIKTGAAGPDKGRMPLGMLRQTITVTPGQRIAYVTDAADTPANRQAIVRLAQNADLLFIEAAFIHEDLALARERAHLTTTAAGEIARQARVRRVEPFHFSPRYNGQETRMIGEVVKAFNEGSSGCG